MYGDHTPVLSMVPVPEFHYGYLIEIDGLGALCSSDVIHGRIEF